MAKDDQEVLFDDKEIEIDLTNYNYYGGDATTIDVHVEDVDN